MPWARIGELVGHDDLMTTARTYTHVVAEEDELDYAGLLDGGGGAIAEAEPTEAPLVNLS
jgi:hypothetical protein